MTNTAVMTSRPMAPPQIIDPDYYRQHGPPHRYWTELRRSAPVAYCPDAPGFLPFWAVTKREDIVNISKDPERFLSAPMLAMFHAEGGVVDGSQLRHLLNMDNPDHRRYRKLLSDRFTPRALKMKLADYERLVDRILDSIVARHGRVAEVDFVTEVSALLPIWIIADMLGVPDENRQQFFDWTNQLIGAGDPEFRQEGASVEETSTASRMAQMAFFQEMVEERRRRPGDDMTSVLANATLDDSPLPPFELLSYLVLLVVAGNETTRNAASGGLLALLEHPHELHKLQADHSLLGSAVEEAVRWQTPVNQFCRTPNEDVVVSGQQIRAGEHLCLFYASANRDEDVFVDPFDFRIDRQPNLHIGFGIGEHVCMGANLARLELSAIFGRLLARLESVEQLAPVERLRSSFINGIKHLEVRLEFRS